MIKQLPPWELTKLFPCKLDVEHQPYVKHPLGKLPKIPHCNFQLKITKECFNYGGSVGHLTRMGGGGSSELRNQKDQTKDHTLIGKRRMARRLIGLGAAAVSP